MGRRWHKWLRGAYGAVPFKRPLFHALRRFWRPSGRMAEHLWFKGPFTVDAGNGRSFRMVNHGQQLENLVFWHGLFGDWEPVSMRAWAKACEGRAVVLDIGANTGLFGLVARTVAPRAQVHCFEPMARVRERLNLNNAINGGGLQVHGIALSDQEGTAMLHLDAGDHGYLASLERTPHFSGERVEVPVRRLDRVLAEAGIDQVDVIKIDVEHHEPAVLRGMGRYLRQLPTLLIEVLDETAAAGIEEAIAGLGYLRFQVDEQAAIEPRARIVAMPPTGGHGYNYILCSPAEALRLGLVTSAAAAPTPH
jgi:FkbM family methyltransferase